ncbi:MAG: hypothetical protein BWX80_02391 [Candidatus Hydrogenedentes bacterium ADurb.Bin101]|jgi:hypothetical protein|nr:MAG: hypothetical protein BWX80_02391 [Candidatus Hydrogenedentes bacterium ADurb.Bin101]HOC68094.1 hypothetical protein [Candidatus Hydrogenedentota bacterium]
MTRTAKERIAAALLLVMALVLLLAGGMRSYKVYDRSDGEFGLLTFTRISDSELVVDATFSGVERQGDRLYTTYDRNAPRGKRSCPT